MFRKIGFGAAAALTVGLLAVGCSEDGDTLISGGSDIRPDNFPGSSVDQNNLADDRRAFTNSGQVADNDDLEIFYNVSNGTAIALFTTTPQNNAQGEILYASYFNGSTFTTPVEIRGENEDAGSGVVGFKVLFLNTAGSTDVETAARNGDAIILFTRNDADPVIGTGVTTVDEDSNTRLYGAYFDVSALNAAPTSTTRGGFQTVATAIDFDNEIDNADVDFGGAGGPDPDVSTFGFSSTSLDCTHEQTDGTDEVDSGESTTFVHIIYRKDPTSGDPAAADIEGERYWSVQFNLAQVGNAMPTATASSVIDLPSGLDDANTTETVSDTFVVHNGHMFWTVSGVDDTASTDQVLVASVFTTAASSSEIVVSSAQADDSNDTATLPQAGNVYGGDDGLSSTYFLFEETGFNDDSTTGDRSGDRDLMLGELRIDAAGATTEGAGSPVEIDAFTSTLDTADADADLVAVRTGNNGDVDAGSVQTRINRAGTYIAVLWTQENTDVTDIDPALNTETAAFPNDVPFTTVIQTRRDSTDARVLADSVAAAEQVGALESDADASDDAGQNQADVDNVQFQGGLAQGQAKSQSDEICDRGCSFQGNNLRYSVLFEQFEDQTGAGDIDNNILYLNSYTVTLGATATDAPTLADTGADEVEELDSDYNLDFEAFAVDAGDDSTTATNPPAPSASAGRVLVFFVSNNNNELDDTTTGSFEEPRLFVSEQSTTGTAGTKALVSTDPAGGVQDDAFLVTGVQGAALVPVNEDTVNSPNYVGDTLYVFWTENRNLPGSGRSLMTRSHDQNDTTASNPSVALADRFTPPLPSSTSTASDNPVQIDNPTPGDLLQFNSLQIGQAGTTVGVYFDEDRHVYYSDSSTDATGFDSENGVPAPQLVDNDQQFNTTVQEWSVHFPPECNDLTDSIVVYEKFDLNTLFGVQGQRLFLRVHN